MQLTANFAINQYTLAYTAGAHGTLSGKTPQTVNYGASGTAVTAVPAAGYHFVKWSDNSTANPRTDVNVAKNVAVTASFAITQYTLTYAAGAHGTLSGKTPQPVSDGASGTAVTAIPETGYHFVKWSDNSTANPRTDVNVTKNVSVTASFAIDQYAVTFRTDGTKGASLTGMLTQTVNYGANCTAVTAKAPAGSAFIKWTRNGLTYSRNNPLAVTGVKEPMVLRAVFNPGNAAKDWSRYE
jgi:uncharacterized repeat protein (TIGR02543 family)